jgi:hypothetical protein
VDPALGGILEQSEVNVQLQNVLNDNSVQLEIADDRNSHRRTQSGSTATIRINYVIQCSSNCNSISDSLTNIAQPGSAAGLAHAASILSAIQAVAVSQGFPESAVISTAAEVQATLTPPAVVMITVPPPSWCTKFPAMMKDVSLTDPMDAGCEAAAHLVNDLGCHVAPNPCADDAAFLDEQNYSCAGWDGYDCSTAEADWGYTTGISIAHSFALEICAASV